MSSARWLTLGCLGLLVALGWPAFLGVALLGALLSSTGRAGEPATLGPLAGGVPLRCPSLTVARGFQPPVHSGIDLDCPAGTPVLAAAPGILHRHADGMGSCSVAGGVPAGGYGRYAVVDLVAPAATQEYYGHLEAWAAGDGASVSAGEVIGYEGSTGCSTGPHLHFEVRHFGRPVNPCPHLADGYPSAAWRSAGCPLHLPS